jgi:hypothetical protein
MIRAYVSSNSQLTRFAVVTSVIPPEVCTRLTPERLREEVLREVLALFTVLDLLTFRALRLKIIDSAPGSSFQ